MTGWLYIDQLKYCTLATYWCEWVDQLSCHDWMAVWWPAKILYPVTHCCDWVDELNCHDWMALWWPAKILYPSHTLLWADELSCHDWMAVWWPAKILYSATHSCEQMNWAVMTGWLYGDQLKYFTQTHIFVRRWAVVSWLDGCMVYS